jgi:hypothetical protein
MGGISIIRTGRSRRRFDRLSLDRAVSPSRIALGLLVQDTDAGVRRTISATPARSSTMKMRATDKEGRHSQLTAFSSCSFDHGVETPDLLPKLMPVDENQSLQRIRVARGS